MDRMTRRRSLLAAAAVLALLALAIAGCGSSSDQDYGGQHPDYATALAGSPPPLAALHKQADQLLGGGVDAYEQRIATLEGYPVVTNVWASWCGPCREEFPTLQKLSARYGKRVAFVGVNSKDGDDTAATFLAEAPLSYPSYTDPDGGIAASLGTIGGLPDTAFYNRDGELCHLQQGQYAQQSDLEADVRRYALQGECESG
jgi:cytochrome c biogenesis protein CcmG/thiol:disulfide interchange protein DsbE